MKPHTMDQFTMKDLRKIATDRKLVGRSKYTKKADLYKVLRDLYGEKLDGNLAEEDEQEETSAEEPIPQEKEKEVEDKQVEESAEKKASVKETSKPGYIQQTLFAYRKSVKPKLVTEYDFVVIQCLSTAEFFPIIFSESLEINPKVYKMSESADVVWMISDDKQGTTGFKESFNTPFALNFVFEGDLTIPQSQLALTKEYRENVQYVGDDDIDVSGLDVLAWEITPTLNADKLGYGHLLKKYGELDPKTGAYYIEDYQEFACKLMCISQEWDYVPDFVHDIKQCLDRSELAYNQSIIFWNMNCDKLTSLKSYILNNIEDGSQSFNTARYLTTNKGRNIVYLQTYPIHNLL